MFKENTHQIINTLENKKPFKQSIFVKKKKTKKKNKKQQQQQTKMKIVWEIRKLLSFERYGIMEAAIYVT